MAGKKLINGENEYIKHSARSNLTKSEIRAIKELCNSIFDGARVISAYRRHKNLRDYLVKGYFGEPLEAEDPEAIFSAVIFVVEQDEDAGLS